MKESIQSFFFRVMMFVGSWLPTMWTRPGDTVTQPRNRFLAVWRGWKASLWVDSYESPNGGEELDRDSFLVWAQLPRWGEGLEEVNNLLQVCEVPLPALGGEYDIVLARGEGAPRAKWAHYVSTASLGRLVETYGNRGRKALVVRCLEGTVSVAKVWPPVKDEAPCTRCGGWTGVVGNNAPEWALCGECFAVADSRGIPFDDRGAWARGEETEVPHA